MIGRVVSTKTTNTVTVLVERVAKHPLYKKTFIRSKRYLVDDRLGVKEGDVVEIIKTRPISKNKHWQAVKVVGRNLAEMTEEKLKTEAEKIIAEAMPEEKTEEPSDASRQAEKAIKKEEEPRKRKGSLKADS